MQAVLQTDNVGLQSFSVQNIEPESFLPTSIEIHTVAVPILPFDIMKLEGTLPTKIPNVMGYGAVGEVTKVGVLRSNKLLNKRVLIFNPNGTFQDTITSNLPPLTIPIPDNVTYEEATTVVGGLDTALVIYKKIINSSVRNIIITGADSVIGLGVLQLLKDSKEKNILPVIRPISQDYFKHRQVKMMLPDYDVDQTVLKEDTLIIDIAGNFEFLQPYIKQNFTIMSVALPNINGIRFISEPIFPKNYAQLLQKISKKELFAPIDHTFQLSKINQAFKYQKSNPSRGRNILLFK
ncbi:hypothetical protein FKV73_02735 [Weissella paramesenteroides]|nr:hypothetical protein FKV79_04735 [Weissella paramesenteroides]KAA8438601.1 hypothetical protein FKV73_02735 [Weissella paramesenteroides]